MKEKTERTVVIAWRREDGKVVSNKQEKQSESFDMFGSNAIEFLE